MSVHRHLAALVFVASVGAATSVRAAQPPQTAGTRLELGASASAEVQETLLVASLVAAAEGRDPAAVQGSVNAAMTKALATAQNHTDVKATTGGYAIRPIGREPVDPVNKPPRRLRGEQTLSLASEASAAVLDLVGRLQAMGLETRSLDYELPAGAVERTRRRLLDDALHDLRATAEQAATAMGMRLDGWDEVRVEPAGGAPSPPFRAMMAERATSASPPVAVSGTQRVTLTVSGTALLMPSR